MPFTSPEIAAILESQLEWCERPAYGDPITPWFRVFLWRPQRMWTGHWRWLCTVERRLVQKKEHLPGPFCQWFQYRLAR
jgi:hypothetical protein